MFIENSNIPPVSPAQAYARRFSIFVKNVPDELNNIGELNNYFKR